jgi:hypothetical protein
MKGLLSTVLAIGFASAAFADHREPDILNPDDRHRPGLGTSDNLEYSLESLIDAAQSEAYESRLQRNQVLAQRYQTMADQAQRMANNVRELNSGYVHDPERYYYDLRIKMHDIEQIARGIRYLPYHIQELIQDVRIGVDELTEGGGHPGHPGHPGGGHGGRGQYQATCEVTLVSHSTFSMNVSGLGRSRYEAIEAAKDAGERQCRANRARCYIGQCDVVRLR